MTWIKRNIWIVVLSVVSIVIFPVAWKFSSGMNKKLQEGLQKEVSAAFNSVNQTVSYVGIQIDPNTPPIEKSGVAPNPFLTERFMQIRQAQQEQLNEVITLAETFNRRERTPLIDDLFPVPLGEYPILTKIAMNQLFVTGPGHPPSVYELLFNEINGGSPADPTDLKIDLQDLRSRSLAEKEAEDGNVRLSDDEKEEIEQKLIDRRIATYRQRANQLSVYVDMSCLPSPDDELWPRLYPAQMAQPPAMAQCYMWQHDYWAISDVIAAIGNANTDVNGEPTSIPESPVKRIAHLELTSALIPREALTGGKDPTAGTVMDAGAAPLNPDYGYGLTGRFSSPDNRLYDVRNVMLDVIVSMDKLPMFFDALAETNFITITDLDLEPVNVMSEISTGYYYGDDFVVKAKMKLEVLLLRSWTEPYTPDEVKYLLGFPPRQDNAGFGDGFDEEDNGGG